MNDTQPDMFASQAIDPRVLDNLDHLLDDENEWPITFLKLRDILDSELNELLPEHKKVSLSLALVIGQYLGGMSNYLPTGQLLQKYIRDINIWEAFTGHNVKSLAMQHRLSEKAIYQVLHRMRAISSQRSQILRGRIGDVDSKWNRYFEPVGVEGDIHLEEEKKKWPMALLELRTLLLKELEAYDVNEHEVALSMVLAIGQKMGGEHQYIARGDILYRHVRNIEIWESYNGNNVKQLAHQYKVTDKTIYEILAKMKKLESKKWQPDLF
ncbi:Mor transcription activator family protein [Vibrio sp. LaRot3]|uniref:Mor transcription activator family protein n=1 Tax=Vibrio sp. LaRot3 TaxID=2998829 RepID=UPI0022CE0BFC|nr:Mor transcription activator family protein [Vibrio sp. LaRot3]MDA0148835.1 hypothetical protein [Vibrio sp. LaRot3]